MVTLKNSLICGNVKMSGCFLCRLLISSPRPPGWTHSWEKHLTTKKKKKKPNTKKNCVVRLTNRDRGDLCVDVQHAVVVHIHKVVALALLVVTEEVDCSNILGWRGLRRFGDCVWWWCGRLERRKERQKNSKKSIKTVQKKSVIKKHHHHPLRTAAHN